MISLLRNNEPFLNVASSRQRWVTTIQSVEGVDCSLLLSRGCQVVFEYVWVTTPLFGASKPLAQGNIFFQQLGVAIDSEPEIRRLFSNATDYRWQARSDDWLSFPGNIRFFQNCILLGLPIPIFLGNKPGEWSLTLLFNVDKAYERTYCSSPHHFKPTPQSARCPWWSMNVLRWGARSSLCVASANLQPFWGPYASVSVHRHAVAEGVMAHAVINGRIWMEGIHSLNKYKSYLLIHDFIAIG